MVSSSIGVIGSLTPKGRDEKSYQPFSAQHTNILRAEKSCGREREDRQLCCVRVILEVHGPHMHACIHEKRNRYGRGGGGGKERRDICGD